MKKIQKKLSNYDEFSIRKATFPADEKALSEIVREYFTWLELPTSHRGFAEEIKNLEGHYSPPSGVFLLLVQGEIIQGCVALWAHSPQIAEVKRLYVKQSFRGKDLGQRLMLAAIEQARKLSFEQLILGAIPKTTSAQALYAKLGFRRVEPFYSPAPEGTAFYKLYL